MLKSQQGFREVWPWQRNVCFFAVLYRELNEQVSVPVPEHEAHVPIPVVQVVPVQVLGMQVQVEVPVLS